MTNREEKDKNIVKVCTFSPYRRRRKSKRQTLLVFKGKVLQNATAANSFCKILVDSGCEETVISKRYAEKLNLLGEKTNLKAELWDGTLVPM